MVAEKQYSLLTIVYKIILCFLAFATVVTALNAEEENDPPTYKDAFPPLPEKACLEPAQEPAGAWSKIRPIKASVITQVSTKNVFSPSVSNPVQAFRKTSFRMLLVTYLIVGEKI